MLRYGKHRGRHINLQVSGWAGLIELADTMQIPHDAVYAIAIGSKDFKGYNRFVVREEDGKTLVRPYYFEGSKARKQQGWYG